VLFAWAGPGNPFTSATPCSWDYRFMPPYLASNNFLITVPKCDNKCDFKVNKGHMLKLDDVF
jgi:hypothetical protein